MHLISKLNKMLFGSNELLMSNFRERKARDEYNCLNIAGV